MALRLVAVSVTVVETKPSNEGNAIYECLCCGADRCQRPRWPFIQLLYGVTIAISLNFIILQHPDNL